MANNRKLGRPSDQRNAVLRNQVTQLLWHGRIETTLDRAKEVRSIAEKLITIAMNSYKDTVEVTKEVNNDKGQTETITVKNDLPSRLHARRQIMRVVYDMKELRKDDESKWDYRKRTKDVKHPMVEKMFSEIGPKYDKRREEKGQGGGYTRIIKKGARRGDAAEMVILELV